VPANQIEFIHDHDTPQAKAALFKRVNDGDVRFLLGSTPKMGAGTNVQQRLVAEHHIDAPWRPSDLEQREGRIIRRGNLLYAHDPENFEVEILRYATRQTYDTRRWQLLEHKAAGVEQLRNYSGEAEIDDVASEAANSAEMKAAASGNPLILKETQLATEIKKLNALSRAHLDQEYSIRNRMHRNRNYAERFGLERLSELEQMIRLRDEAKTLLVWNGNSIADKEWALEAMTEVGKTLQHMEAKQTVTYRGVKFKFERESAFGPSFFMPDGNGVLLEKFSPSGVITRMENYLMSLEEKAVKVREHIAEALVEADKQAGLLGKPFEQEAELKAKIAEHGKVQRDLQKANSLGAVRPEERVIFEAEVKARKAKLIELGYGQAVKEIEVEEGEEVSAVSVESTNDEKVIIEDSGWHYAGTGIGGRIEQHRNLSLNDGTVVKGVVYEVAGRYTGGFVIANGQDLIRLSDLEQRDAQPVLDTFLNEKFKSKLDQRKDDVSIPETIAMEAVESQAEAVVNVSKVNVIADEGIANTTPVASDMQKYILVAADSIDLLRKVDVYRVLVKSNKPELRNELATYIKVNRPDLANEVDDILQEEKATSVDASGQVVDETQSATMTISSVVEPVPAKPLLKGDDLRKEMAKQLRAAWNDQITDTFVIGKEYPALVTINDREVRFSLWKDSSGGPLKCKTVFEANIGTQFRFGTIKKDMYEDIGVKNLWALTDEAMRIHLSEFEQVFANAEKDCAVTLNTPKEKLDQQVKIDSFTKAQSETSNVDMAETAVEQTDQNDRPIIAPAGIPVVDFGHHLGEITEVKNGYAVQDVGRGNKKAHALASLSAVPEVGLVANIKYKQGKGNVFMMGQGQSQAVER
jgi:hypothetical protein